MKKKIKTYTIEHGRMVDLKTKTIYLSTWNEHYDSKEVFIGKYPVWGKNERWSYLVFDLDGTFLGEAHRMEMDEVDLRMAVNDRKYKKIIKKIETFKELKAKYDSMEGNTYK